MWMKEWGESTPVLVAMPIDTPSFKGKLVIY